MSVKKKTTVYDVVTDRFLAQLKEGIVPWQKPWISIEGERVGGWSHKSGESYSIVNQMMLPTEGEYITYKQIRDEGGSLKEGAEGYPICFWKNYVTEVKDPDTNTEEPKSIPVLRYYTVYRVEDCDGIEPNFEPDPSPLDGKSGIEKIEAAEELCKAYLKMSGVKLEHHLGDRACYMPAYDTVKLPLEKQFEDAGEYYSTLFHELTHSTGHRDRLNRLGAGGRGMRSHAYSLEELVAEIGAASILYKLGIESESTIQNSNAYLKSWYDALSDNPRMIVKASSRAQKAVRYIYGDDKVFPHGDWKPPTETAS